MEEDVQGRGAVDETDGGANQESDHDSNPENEVVSKAELERVLADMHRYKRRWKEAESKLQEKPKPKGGQDDDNPNDYKSLAERYRTEAESWKSKADGWRNLTIQEKKFAELMPALQRAGLRDEAKDLIDLHGLDDLEVEQTDQGRMIVHGVSSFVESFKSKYPFAFRTARAPSVNSSGGANKLDEGELLSPQDIVDLEKKCRKNGDMKPYREAVIKYKQQRQAQARQRF